MSTSPAPSPLALRVVLWTWLIAALLVGKYALLTRLPAPALPALIVALTALVFLAYRRLPAVRATIDALPLSTFLALHLTRFVGLYFLLLYRQGDLPYAFAVPAGIGDLVVAVTALALLLIPLTDATRARAVAIWNTVGFIDLVLVVLTAARLNAAQPGSMSALTVLPLSLLPTFLVPLLLATHLLLYSRLKQ